MYNPDNDLLLTEDLKFILLRQPDEYDGIIASLKDLTDKLSQIFVQNPERALLEVNSGLNQLTSKSKVRSTCMKGCHYCCHITVHLTELEAATIARYCQRHDITISTTYLKQQLLHKWDEIPLTPVSSCVFLKDGLCEIYPVRPIACRSYRVSTPPFLCDHKKFQGKDYNVIHIAEASVEILRSAFYNCLSRHGLLKIDRMPELLLPYSK